MKLRCRTIGRAMPVLIVCSLAVAATTAAAQFSRHVPLGLDAFMPVPETNPLTPAKIELGARLFNERRLSADSSVSCATCHDRTKAFTDARPFSIGVFARPGRRSAPTLVNRGYGRVFFWDGRAATLEEQVLGPIENPNELGNTLTNVLRFLEADSTYAAAFNNAFGAGADAQRLSQALASYVRTISSGDAPIDRFTEGDGSAISERARFGLTVFRGKGRCTTCHVGPTFSDEGFHNTGVAWNGQRFVDHGRAALTGRAADRGAFKTPTLREISRTAPYMHDGSLATLDDVVEYYDAGGRANPALDPELRPLRLRPDEKRGLTAFLESLSGTIGEGLRPAVK